MSFGFAGGVDQVRESLRNAHWRVRLEFDEDVPTSLALVRCVILDLGAMEVLQAPIERARLIGHDRFATPLMVQVTSAYAARGETDESRAMASDFLEYATEVGHRARQIDAEVALTGLRARTERSHAAAGLAAEAQRLFNNHAMWKLFIAQYRQQVLWRESSEATETHALLVTHHDWMNPGYRNSFAELDGYRSALADPPEGVDLPIPELPTLLSLPNILASAEAVAIGGTLSAAADWLAWLEAELPAFVVTSLEWPACRGRVEGLLLSRVGQRARALEALEGAVRCCEERGDTIEAEIGRAQLAALSGDAQQSAIAASRLDEIGIDATVFVAAAQRAEARAALVPEMLTEKEARVVGRVARGLSYREIEAEMGLPPRGTARATATAYPKLGVKGRVHAARLALELLIA